MFRIIKKNIIFSLLLVFLIQPTTNAQSLNQKGLNLLNFLGLQLDISDILEDYKTNLLLNDNTCKQADRFAILQAQDEIVNNLLQNFDTITKDKRVELLNQYQILEVELEFLKNIDILIQNQNYSSALTKLNSVIIDKLPSNLTSVVNDNIQNIANKYEDRHRIYDPTTDSFKEGTYVNCPTSWSSISKRVDNINSEVLQIQQEWTDLIEASNKIKNTSQRTFSTSNIKSVTVQAKNAVLDGAKNSYQNLAREWNQARQEAYQIAVRPIETYQQTLQQNQNLLINRNDIKSLLLSNTSITEITQELNQQADLEFILSNSLIDKTALQITLQHSDIGHLSIINKAFQTPNILQENLQIFKTENEDGLLGKSKQVSNQQCNI